MSTTSEKLNSLKSTRRFLLDLLDPKKTPRVPKKTREQAGDCLKHYPFALDLALFNAYMEKRDAGRTVKRS